MWSRPEVPAGMLTSCLSQGCLKCASELREEHRRRNSQTRGRSDHTCTELSVAGLSFNTVTNQIHVTILPNSLTCHMPGQTWSTNFKMWWLGVPLIGANIFAEHDAPIFRVEEWMKCLFYPDDWRGSFIQNTDNYLRGGADKSLAQPGRKQATATKLGIYSTYSPWSPMHFLAHCSNSCKPLKKN